MLHESSLLLQEEARIEVGIADFSNRAVTHEGAEAINISNHSFVVCLSKHKGGKLPDRSENHHDVV